MPQWSWENILIKKIQSKLLKCHFVISVIGSAELIFSAFKHRYDFVLVISAVKLVVELNHIILHL